jgi:flagellar protein FliS
MTPANILSRYGAVQASTGKPGQILVMLYDGLFRFLNEARSAMAERRRGRAGEAISRAHAIIDTLCSTLDPAHAPALCENLEALYLYCMQRLIAANLESRPEPIDEVLRILAPLRDAWHEVVEGPRAAAPADAR